MQQNDEAFVLRTQALGEADLIVSFLARHHGHLRGVARSARRSRKRFGGLLEPMTHVQATWSTRDGRELHRVEQLEGKRSFAVMQADPVRQAVCAVLAEITEAFGAEGDANPKEFRLLQAVLEALEGGGDPLGLLRYFEFWTLRIHGLLADPTRCTSCAAFLTPGAPKHHDRHAGFSCPACQRSLGGTGRRLGAAEAAWLDRARLDPPTALVAAGRVTGCGGGLESLFRGTLEAYAERRFRAYRHVQAMIAVGEVGA